MGLFSLVAVPGLDRLTRPPIFSVVVGGCGGGCGVGVWWCVECCIVDASILLCLVLWCEKFWLACVWRCCLALCVVLVLLW